jgi:hypothetical protein
LWPICRLLPGQVAISMTTELVGSTTATLDRLVGEKASDARSRFDDDVDHAAALERTNLDPLDRHH